MKGIKSAFAAIAGCTLLSFSNQGCSLLVSSLPCDVDLDCPTGDVCLSGFCEREPVVVPAMDAGTPADSGLDAGSEPCNGLCGPGSFCRDNECVLAPDDAGSPADSGTDAGDDAGQPVPDAGADAGVPTDAGLDAGTDAGPDAGFDAGPDAGLYDAGEADAGDTDAGCVIPAFSIGGDRDGDGILDENDLITVLDTDCDGITETVCVATSTMSSPWRDEPAFYQGSPDQMWGGLSAVRLSQTNVSKQIPGAAIGMLEWCHDFTNESATNYIYRYVSTLQDDGVTPLAEDDSCAEWVIMNMHAFCTSFGDALCRYGSYSLCGTLVGYVIGVQWDPTQGISGI